MEKNNVTYPEYFNETLAVKEYERKGWSRYRKDNLTERFDEFATDVAIDLLDKMLRYDHLERIAPKDAMEHPYFDPLKE